MNLRKFYESEWFNVMAIITIAIAGGCLGGGWWNIVRLVSKSPVLYPDLAVMSMSTFYCCHRLLRVYWKVTNREKKPPVKKPPVKVIATFRRVSLFWSNREGMWGVIPTPAQEGIGHALRNFFDTHHEPPGDNVEFYLNWLNKGSFLLEPGTYFQVLVASYGHDCKIQAWEVIGVVSTLTYVPQGVSVTLACRVSQNDDVTQKARAKLKTVSPEISTASSP